MGLIGALELVEDKAAHKNFDPARKVGGRYSKIAEANGVIARTLPNDVIAMSPPLIIKEAELDEMFDGMAKSLDQLAAELHVA
jgi:4-aminobutyrate--pyruvate transaminase